MVATRILHSLTASLRKIIIMANTIYIHFLDIKNNYYKYPKKEFVISENAFWISVYITHATQSTEVSYGR